MAYKMKGSPAAMGKIQGTSGHASALKQLDATKVSLTKPKYVPHFIQKDGKQIVNPDWSLNVNDRRETFENAQNGDKDVNQYKTPEEIAAGDKKSKWGFNPMDALKSFLSSGGGKEGLLKGIGAGITDKEKERELKRVKHQKLDGKI
tara:strand:- start:21 stop:461 length:441 start_codon:yes stop_codon:yes gene_type:complete